MDRGRLPDLLEPIDLEAALEREQQEQDMRMHQEDEDEGVGLGIGVAGGQEDESDISEEE